MRIFWIMAVLLLTPAAMGQQSDLMSLLDGGHYKRARAIAEPRTRQNPKDAEALYVMGRVRQAYNDGDGAYTYAEKAVQADGTKAPYHCLLGEASGNKAEKAGAFSKFGLGRAVKKEAEAGIAIDPKYAPCYHLLIVFHLKAPGIIGGDKNKAQELATKLMSIDPVEGAFAQARIANENKAPTSTFENLYGKAVQANPKSYKANMQLAGLYAGQKRYDQAEKYAREAIKIDPSRGAAYALLVQLAVLQEKWTEVENLLGQSEKAVPDNLNAYYQAARVSLAENKDVSRAEKYLRKYLTQEPEGSTPSWANAHWRLALVFEKQGRKAEALNELRSALSLDPSFEPAKKDLDRLK
jgi:tetratricopeptide (TPR) repeat protein